MGAVDTGAPARAARVFLSYKRDVEPDQALAGEIVRGLEQAGHGVFIDQRLTVGQAWAREIEKQVARRRLPDRLSHRRLELAARWFGAKSRWPGIMRRPPGIHTFCRYASTSTVRCPIR